MVNTVDITLESGGKFMKSTDCKLIPKMGNKFKFTFKTIETALMGVNTLLTRELRSATAIEYLPSTDGIPHCMELVFTDDTDNEIFQHLLEFSQTAIVDIKLEYISANASSTLRTVQLIEPKIVKLRSCNFDYNNNHGLMTLHLFVAYHQAKIS